MAVELPELILRDAVAWRRWLDRNHADSSGVFLVLAKKGTTQPTRLVYQDALVEALRFGWIDGQTAKRDESTYKQRFTPRRSRSPWSARNVGIAEKLIAEGQMEPAGLAEVERAKGDGRWDSAYAGPATIEVPADLQAALDANADAAAMFAVLTAQNRFAILYRLSQAKRAETRTRRLEQYVSMLARGETIYPQRRRPSS